MKLHQAQALGRLTAQELAGAVSHVEQVHSAVAHRALAPHQGTSPATASGPVLSEQPSARARDPHGRALPPTEGPGEEGGALER